MIFPSHTILAVGVSVSIHFTNRGFHTSCSNFQVFCPAPAIRPVDECWLYALFQWPFLRRVRSVHHPNKVLPPTLHAPPLFLLSSLDSSPPSPLVFLGSVLSLSSRVNNTTPFSVFGTQNCFSTSIFECFSPLMPHTFKVFPSVIPNQDPVSLTLFSSLFNPALQEAPRNTLKYHLPPIAPPLAIPHSDRTRFPLKRPPHPPCRFPFFPAFFKFASTSFSSPSLTSTKQELRSLNLNPPPLPLPVTFPPPLFFQFFPDGTCVFLTPLLTVGPSSQSFPTFPSVCKDFQPSKSMG